MMRHPPPRSRAEPADGLHEYPLERKTHSGWGLALAGVTIAKAAGELGTSVSQLRLAVKAGCPHWRVGNSPRGALRFDTRKAKPWLLVWNKNKRGPGRPQDVDLLLAEPAAQARSSASDEVTDEDREALIAAGFSEEEVDGILGLPANVVKKMAAVGKARKELAEAEKKERENERKAGNHVPTADVVRFWLEQATLLHARLGTVPAKVAKEAANCSYDEVYEAVELAIHAALSGLAKEFRA